MRRRSLSELLVEATETRSSSSPATRAFAAGLLLPREDFSGVVRSPVTLVRSPVISDILCLTTLAARTAFGRYG